MAFNFQQNHVYSFDTLAPAILGAKFKNATHLGTISYLIAQQRENIYLKYRQIYPALPQGTVDDPEKQIYHLFKTENGNIVTLCDQWINDSTVEEIQAINFNVYFSQGTLVQMNDVRDMLLAAGYTNFKIE